MTKPAPTQSFDELLGLPATVEVNLPAIEGEQPEEPVEPDHPETDTRVEIEIRERVGRPKGRIDVRKSATKSSVTQQRLALEAGIRDYMAHPNRRKLLRDALDRLLRVAAYGLDDNHAVRAAAVLMEKFLSSAKQEEEISGSGPPQVHIVIENATARVAPPAIEAQFTEVKRT
jgi:hypothetical protein